MSRFLVLIALLFAYLGSYAQSSYRGYLGKYPIDLIINTYGDAHVVGCYSYTKYDTPIQLSGKISDGQLRLMEKDESDNHSASFVFDAFDQASEQLNGIWTMLSNGKSYKIKLTKQFDLPEPSTDRAKGIYELGSMASTKDHYFQTMIAVEGFEERVVGVKVFEKKTDKLIQTLNMDCRWIGLSSLNVGDFNFDGTEDFSVFEESFAGANTSSLYFLNTGEAYTLSSISGVSLQFDPDLKLIYEVNSCCAGSGTQKTFYRIENDEMIYLEQKCYKYNEALERDEEVKCRD